MDKKVKVWLAILSVICVILVASNVFLLTQINELNSITSLHTDTLIALNEVVILLTDLI